MRNVICLAIALCICVRSWGATPTLSEACPANLTIMPGEEDKCREAGTQTFGKNCCKQDGTKSIKDTMNSSGVQQNKYMELVGQAADISVSDGSSAAAAFLTSNFDPGTVNVTNAQIQIAASLLDACNQEDMKTTMLSDSGYCVTVGEYCSESWPLVGCVQKDIKYCCFNSVLARIIHEQGRPQIPSMGGFGTPEAPNCRGFTIAEFQSLDFSKIDFSEYADQIRTETQSKMQSVMQDMANDKIH